MDRIPVFYSERIIAPDQGASPSAHKPAHVVADWQARGFPIEVIAPIPVTREQIALAHEASFVDDVLGCHTANGFGNHSKAVADSLPYTSGAMLAAARMALANGRVAVAPVSGFHHATFDAAGGFCTFNGLMVAACVLHAERLVERVGILDFDLHYGNGTDDIVRRRRIDWIEHCTAGAGWRQRSQAAEFLDAIPGIVAQMSGCEVILYQAGADPHVDDPYGGWLTTGELRERDRHVFAAAQEWGVPEAWNLAGGYRRTDNGGIEPVLAIHRNTMAECVARYTTAGARSSVQQASAGSVRERP